MCWLYYKGITVVLNLQQIWLTYFISKLMYICENFNCKLEKLCIFFILNYTLDELNVPFFIFISILNALSHLVVYLDYISVFRYFSRIVKNWLLALSHVSIHVHGTTWGWDWMHFHEIWFVYFLKICQNSTLISDW